MGYGRDKKKSSGGRMGKKILKTVLVIAIIAGVGYLFYNDKPKKIEPSQQEKEANVSEFLYREDAVLLSIKYKADEEKVFNLLVDVNDVREILTPWTKERILSLSEKYGMPEDKIVDIILNFRLIERDRYRE